MGLFDEVKEWYRKELADTFRQGGIAIILGLKTGFEKEEKESYSKEELIAMMEEIIDTLKKQEDEP